MSFLLRAIFGEENLRRVDDTVTSVWTSVSDSLMQSVKCPDCEHWRWEHCTDCGECPALGHARHCQKLQGRR